MAITDLRVADASLPIGGKSPLAHPVTYMEEVRFPYRVNSFAIDCAVLDFRRPEKNQFSFRLEGRDEGWTHLGVQPRISLIDLAPGRYVLRVHGAGCDGRWNEAGASLAIVISPPFWRTWAFGLLIAALLLLLAAYVAWNQRRIRRLKRAGIPADLDRILEKYKVSKREAEVLRLVLAGKSNREIEEDLYISLATVKIHIYNVYRKMKVKSRIQLLHRIQEEASRRS